MTHEEWRIKTAHEAATIIGFIDPGMRLSQSNLELILVFLDGLSIQNKLAIEILQWANRPRLEHGVAGLTGAIEVDGGFAHFVNGVCVSVEPK